MAKTEKSWEEGWTHITSRIILPLHGQSEGPVCLPQSPLQAAESTQPQLAASQLLEDLVS
jgi:hypothetical protein